MRYMREISLSFTTDPLFMDGCYAILKSLKQPMELNQKFILIDNHVHSPLSDFPFRGMVLPRDDGEITPLLFHFPLKKH